MVKPASRVMVWQHSHDAVNWENIPYMPWYMNYSLTEAYLRSDEQYTYAPSPRGRDFTIHFNETKKDDTQTQQYFYQAAILHTFNFERVEQLTMKDGKQRTVLGGRGDIFSPLYYSEEDYYPYVRALEWKELNYESFSLDSISEDNTHPKYGHDENWSIRTLKDPRNGNNEQVYLKAQRLTTKFTELEFTRGKRARVSPVPVEGGEQTTAVGTSTERENPLNIRTYGGIAFPNLSDVITAQQHEDKK